MSNHSITLFEQGREISYNFEDLEKYHGIFAPGGIAQAIKVMQKAIPLLSDDGYIERRELKFTTSFPGGGFRDAIEMMTRAVSEDRYHLDPELNASLRDKGNRSKFLFHISYRDKTVKLILRAGHVRDEFFELVGLETKSNDQTMRIAELKLEMTQRLLKVDGRFVYATLEEEAAS
ncbi:hypothetical protein [Cohaesibacter celericrescens]|uniref:Uncharacterized protein n=1 Tax=Cohaesibacter celericrescens TaxID=2067669 RepID=A0A2N5XQA4_9HYPH|nr:hypothetical protein [Cohaesibacter celericrescens]PLW76620.1 hypothetical protein C0081_13805 [Cohaesibacter celericrescens]